MVRKLTHGALTRCDQAAKISGTIMPLSRLALFASILAVGLGSVSGARPAAAGSLDFLNHMNPRYKKCIADVRAQLLPQYRNDSKISDAIITNCNRKYPAFG
jgi:hypothetical protein